MTRPFTRRSALAAIGLSLFATSAQAQDFPSRPITIMVGLAAGGITDITARLYAEAVSKITGQRVIVENKTGAGGGVAAAAVQNATPDGYTLLVFSGSQHATVPAAGNATYEPVKGFAPVTFLFNSVVVLTVPGDSPAKTMKELHELGRKKQGGLTFGTPGLGSPSHLLGAKILLADKVPFEAAHYRGGSPMMADLITGRVDFSWPTLSTSRSYLADGKLRALALDADKRWDRLPDVPTLDELGYGKQKVASWFALAAPAGTPPAVVGKLNEIFIKASQDPELRRRTEENGTPLATSTPQHMGKAMEEEWQTMQQLAKVLNLRPQ
ncbi:MAG: tripartite tricarboxylate transporter substrate binding protein [Xanthobacteraceae bacterium]|nr:tripartite tricarboxylate transporter substrate binding protein [Xanthobacteraceae bacterium]